MLNARLHKINFKSSELFGHSIDTLGRFSESDDSETRAVTPVVLIHDEFVLANAADIAPIPKDNFRFVHT